MKIGSLFSGYGGLDLAVETVFDAATIWHAEIDPAASRVLAHRFPDVPNLGDVSAVDWSTVPEVDVLAGGFPCQDLSHAGKRLGLRPDTRSGLWSAMAYAISQLRPRYVVAENVRGLLSAEAHSNVEPCPWCLGDGPGEPALRALGAVLGDLADLGYDAQWCGLRAADVGAPHGRYRIFVLAQDASSIGSGPSGARDSEPRWTDGSRRAGEPLGDAADSGRHDARLEIGRGESAWSARGSGVAVADAECERHEQAFGATSGETARSGPFHPVDGRRRACVAADTSRTRLQVADSVAGGLSATQPAADRATADAGSPRLGQHTGGTLTQETGPRASHEPASHRRSRTADDRRDTTADASGNGRDEGQPEPTRIVGRPDAAQRGAAVAADTDSDELESIGRQHTERRDPDRRSRADVAWGPYEPAIRRWETITRRPAPPPTEPGSQGRPRLSPRFVEWMMGLPAGWVTDVPDISRNHQLKMLGNGVVPQQAAAALQKLLAATLAPTDTAGAA